MSPVGGAAIVSEPGRTVDLLNTAEWDHARRAARELPLTPNFDLPGGTGRKFQLVVVFDPDQLPPESHGKGRLKLKLQFSDGTRMPLECAFGPL